MAHADYDCCALCDTKMVYAGYSVAATKEGACSYCTGRLRDVGLDTLPLADLAARLRDNSALRTQLGYDPCIFTNAFDLVVEGGPR